LNRLLKILLILTLLVISNLSAQENVEIIVMDSYVTPEYPHLLKISFFTTEKCQSEIILNKNTYSISKNWVEDHEFSLPIDDINFEDSFVKFKIIAIDSNGNKYFNDENGFELPEANIIQSNDNPGYFNLCIGGIVYLLPSFSLAKNNDKYSFSFTKELPVAAFSKLGSSYPTSYFSLEYSYIFDFKAKNYLRIGYKYLLEPGVVEYLSFGINGVTDFKGFNGFSPEISLGLFKVSNAFTLYTRYRYNFKPKSKWNFHDISMGIMAYFFSFHL